jgi:glycerate 2-kinase
MARDETGGPSEQVRRRVLIAPDKFKGSLPAPEVASAVARGLQRRGPGLEVDLCPVADGGEGTLDAAISAGFRRVPVEVEGPTGEPLTAAYAERDGVALVELAEASGLRRLAGHRLEPLTASTYGVGQLVAAAVSAGNRNVVLAIGGSASSDGGAGLVQALGAQLFDGGGKPLRRGGAALGLIDRIDHSEMQERLDGVKFVIASDVNSPLLGPEGAAAVFGPQKGASPEDVATLERGLSRWASVVAGATGVQAAEQPGAGAAGGVGFGAIALLDASVIGGADMVLDMVHFTDRVRLASLVITGEGSLDEQSLYGKAPIRVAEVSRLARVPAVAVAGRCTITDERLAAAGILRVYTLQAIEPDLSRSIANAGPLLERTGEQVAAVELGL